MNCYEISCPGQGRIETLPSCAEIAGKGLIADYSRMQWHYLPLIETHFARIRSVTKYSRYPTAVPSMFVRISSI